MLGTTFRKALTTTLAEGFVRRSSYVPVHYYEIYIVLWPILVEGWSRPQELTYYSRLPSPRITGGKRDIRAGWAGAFTTLIINALSGQ